MELIQKGKRTRVYVNHAGDYVVEVLRTHNFDGIIEQTWDQEIFMDDGMHSSGGVSTHNLMIEYQSGDKRENALRFADSYEYI